jgi:hypothetical protein
MSFVDGVQVTGTFPIANGRLGTANLHVEGSQAAQGVVRIGASAIVSGTLGGRAFNVNITNVKLASVGPLPSRLGLDVRFPKPALANIR